MTMLFALLGLPALAIACLAVTGKFDKAFKELCAVRRRRRTGKSTDEQLYVREVVEDNEVEPGLFLLQREPIRAVRIDQESPEHGWVFDWRPLSETWVPVRKLDVHEYSKARKQVAAHVVLVPAKGAGR